MKRLYNITSFLLLLLITVPLACSNTDDEIIIKDWKILYDQDRLLQGIINKKDWKKIEIPSAFKVPGNSAKNFQFVWLKGEFDIKDTPGEYKGLSTGRIRFCDEIFINNHFIGSRVPEKVSWNPVPRNYTIPADILERGKNVIYIRLGVYGNEFGGISDDVLIQKEPDFIRTEFINSLIYKQIPFGIIFLYSGFILQSVISFMLNRKEKLFIYFSLVLLILNIFIFFNLPFFKLVTFEIFHAMRISGLIAGSVFTILVIQSIYRLYLSNYNRIIIPLLLLFPVLILISTNSSYFHEISNILIILNHIIILLFIIFIIYRLNLIEQLSSTKTDRILLYANLASLLLAGFLIVIETYLNLTGGHHSGFYVTFISPVAVIFFSIYTAREITRRQVELKLLYEKLKNAENNDRDIFITEASEEKLKRVIGFIDENFTHDISREGLAAAVGLNPSYMGTIFKTYKGITINEYINNLRIDEAIRQLQQSSMKIIDVGFSVGFDNIVSFNRVFKRITGKTPSDYKNNS